MGRRFRVALGAVLVAFSASAATADAAIFQVTRQDDPAPGTCDPGDCSLREAVTAANGSSGQDTIILSGGTYVLSLGQLPTVTDPLTIAGAGASTTRITGGTQAGPSIVLRAGAIAASGADLVLERLTVAGNTVTVDNVAADNITIGAGGVAVTSGSLTLIDSAVRGNSDLARNTV